MSSNYLYSSLIEIASSTKLSIFSAISSYTYWLLEYEDLNTGTISDKFLPIVLKQQSNGLFPSSDCSPLASFNL